MPCLYFFTSKLIKNVKYDINQDFEGKAHISKKKKKLVPQNLLLSKKTCFITLVRNSYLHRMIKFIQMVEKKLILNLNTTVFSLMMNLLLKTLIMPSLEKYHSL